MSAPRWLSQVGATVAHVRDTGSYSLCGRRLDYHAWEAAAGTRRCGTCSKAAAK